MLLFFFFFFKEEYNFKYDSLCKTNAKNIVIVSSEHMNDWAVIAYHLEFRDSHKFPSMML